MRVRQLIPHGTVKRLSDFFHFLIIILDTRIQISPKQQSLLLLLQITNYKFDGQQLNQSKRPEQIPPHYHLRKLTYHGQLHSEPVLPSRTEVGVVICASYILLMTAIAKTNYIGMVSKRVAVAIVLLLAAALGVLSRLSSPAEGSSGGAALPSPVRQAKQLPTKTAAVIDNIIKERPKYVRSTTNTTKSPLQVKPKTTTEESLFDLDEYRLCRIDPAPQEGNPPVLMKGLSMQLEYQCAGDMYETFADDLEGVIREQVQQATFAKGNSWGRRTSILPTRKRQNNSTAITSNTNNDIQEPERAILVMGNSHTRQIISNVLCQYKDQIRKRTVLYSEDESDESKVPVREQQTRNIAMVVEFPHNVKIYIVVNCPFVYSNKWDKVLEDILMRPLPSFDAIVVGRFNDFKASKGTSFEKKMKMMEKEHPEWALDFQNVDGPTVKTVATKYNGTIIWMGMFSQNGQHYHHKAIKDIEKLNNQTKTATTGNLRRSDDHHSTAQQRHLYAINSRQYIEVLKERVPENATTPILDECAVDVRHTVTTCNTNTTDPRYTGGHRCMGHRGGHPDLVSWDLIDVLHQEFV